jgi:hypothetical protein
MKSGRIFANKYRWTTAGYFLRNQSMDLYIYLIALSCSVCDILDVAGTFLQKPHSSTFQALVICTRQYTRTHTKPVSVQVCVQMITSTMYGINNIELIVRLLINSNVRGTS